MRATFIKRRIKVAFIIISMVFVMYSEHKMYGKPTFGCPNVTTQLDDKHHNIYSLAEEYCWGNKSDAADWIMKNNNIKEKDLSVLPYNLIITIKEKKGK